MSKLSPKCQYFVEAPLLSSTALILLGMEFTRAAQVVAGILFHSSIMTSKSCWMLDTWCFSLTLEDAPHVLNRVQVWRHTWPLHHLHLQLHQQGSSHLDGVFGVVITLENCRSAVSEGRASSSASECHSTCWNPCFPQWTAAPQYQQHSCSPRPWCYHHHAWL